MYTGIQGTKNIWRGYIMVEYFPILQNKNRSIEKKFELIGEPVVFKKGTVILQAGTEVEGIYYITEGKVDCYRISADGRKKTTLIEGPGATLSDMPLYDREPQPCNYQAIDDVKAFYINKTALNKAISLDPSIKDYLMLSICKKLRAISNQLVQMCFDDAGSRVAHILFKFAQHYGKSIDDEKSILIECCLTQQFISELAGINRTTTSRIVALLKKDNIIDIVNRKFVIKDMSKIESWGLNYSSEIQE